MAKRIRFIVALLVALGFGVGCGGGTNQPNQAVNTKSVPAPTKIEGISFK